MKVPMYDREPLVKMTLSLSKESYAWLVSDRGNVEKLREIIDRKIGTTTTRRKPAKASD